MLSLTRWQAHQRLCTHCLTKYGLLHLSVQRRSLLRWSVSLRTTTRRRRASLSLGIGGSMPSASASRSMHSMRILFATTSRSTTLVRVSLTSPTAYLASPSALLLCLSITKMSLHTRFWTRMRAIWVSSTLTSTLAQARVRVRGAAISANSDMRLTALVQPLW